jgi:cytochrome c
VRRSAIARAALPLAAALVVLGACGGEHAAARSAGDAARGRALVRQYECGACHVVPGVRGARSHVGPSLAGIGRRAYIARALPNQPEVLADFLRDPPGFAPGTLMPPVGLDERAARDIAAYLHTLE